MPVELGRVRVAVVGDALCPRGALVIRATIPTLDYIEFNVADHCNMTCMGCALFSPIASPGYLSLNRHRQDIARLAELFQGINIIRLIGGEPLLNRRITQVLEVTRESFPRANLRILTNGTLLERMDPLFWSFLRQNEVAIDVTLYPVHRGREDALRGLCQTHSVEVEIKRKRAFKRFLRAGPPGNAASAFARCTFKHSTFLREGLISACHLSSLAYIFNHRFGAEISTEGGSLDIHAPGRTGEQILAFLARPRTTCQHCVEEPEQFEWCLGRTPPAASDWYVKGGTPSRSEP